MLGASPNGRLTDASRPGGLTTFTKVVIDASRLQDLEVITPGLSLVTAISGGWSFGQGLLATAQFGVGGAQYGRGYDPAELTGDYGLSGKTELQYTFRPNIGSFAEGASIRYIQLYNFLDFGVVWDQNPGLLAEPQHTRSLVSAGAGIRLDVGDTFLANAEVSKALTRPVAAYISRRDTKPFRFYFSVAARF